MITFLKGATSEKPHLDKPCHLVMDFRISLFLIAIVKNGGCAAIIRPFCRIKC